MMNFVARLKINVLQIYHSSFITHHFTIFFVILNNFVCFA